MRYVSSTQWGKVRENASVRCGVVQRERHLLFATASSAKKRIYAGFRASDIVLFLLVFGEQRNLRVVVVRVGFLVVREGGFGDDSPPEFSNSHCTRL